MIAYSEGAQGLELKGLLGEHEMFRSVVDAIPQQLCVIDHTGEIVWVNKAWLDFASENSGKDFNPHQRINYLEVCAESAIALDENTKDDQDNSEAKKAYEGIQSVVEGREPVFYFEYPCHSATENRWFMMEVRPMSWAGDQYFVISHHNITKRKEAEELVLALSVVDSLTGLSNRRHFDEFFAEEWRRAQRLQQPVSFIILDIDSFKQFNDNYGHPAGDECLVRVATALKNFARRPGDILARYGGEEFAVVLGNTPLLEAEKVAEKIRSAIFELNLVHEFGVSANRITISAGVAAAYPHENRSEKQLIEAADIALYEAKNAGRNCLAVNSSLIQLGAVKELA